MRLPIKVGAAIAAVVILGGCATPAAGTATQPDPAAATVTAPAPAVSDVCYRAVKAARTVSDANMDVIQAQTDALQGIPAALAGAATLDSASVDDLTALIKKVNATFDVSTAKVLASNWTSLEAECEAGR